MVKIIDRIRLPYVFDERRLPCASWELTFALAVAAAYRTFATDLELVLMSSSLKNETGWPLLDHVLPCVFAYMFLTCSAWSVWCHETLLLTRIEGGIDLLGRLLNLGSFLCVWRMSGFTHMFWKHDEGGIGVGATSQQFAIACMSAVFLLGLKYLRVYAELADAPRNYFVLMLGSLCLTICLWMPWAIEAVPFSVKVGLSIAACFVDVATVGVQCYFGTDSRIRFDSLIGQRYSFMGTITMLSMATSQWKPIIYSVSDQETRPSVLALVYVVYMLWWMYHECVNTLMSRHRLALFAWVYCHGMFFIMLCVFDASTVGLVGCAQKEACEPRVALYSGVSLGFVLITLTIMRTITQWKRLKRFSCIRRYLCIFNGLAGGLLCGGFPFIRDWPAWVMLLFFCIICTEKVIVDLFLFRNMTALLAQVPDVTRLSRTFEGQMGGELNVDRDIISEMFHLDPDGVDISASMDRSAAAKSALMLNPVEGSSRAKRVSANKGKKKEKRPLEKRSSSFYSASDALLGSVEDPGLQDRFVDCVDAIINEGTNVQLFAAKLENLALNLRRLPPSNV